MAEQESITEFPVNSESASNMEGHWYILHTYSGFEQRVESAPAAPAADGQPAAKPADTSDIDAIFDLFKR